MSRRRRRHPHRVRWRPRKRNERREPLARVGVEVGMPSQTSRAERPGYPCLPRSKYLCPISESKGHPDDR